MDLQSIFTNAVQAKRQEEMKISPQLTLGELILKMEAIKNKELPVMFDGEKYHPVSLDSWRGSYCELAFEYEEEGDKKSGNEIIQMLKEAIGKTYKGYKGGEFLMGKTTPLWVANWDQSSGFKKDGDKYCQAVINVEEKKDKIIIITKAIDY